MQNTTAMMAVKMFIPGPDADIVIQGPSSVVLRAVARLAQLEDDRSVEIRPSTNDDGTVVVVDRNQNDGYPEILAEVLPAHAVALEAVHTAQNAIRYVRDRRRTTRASLTESAARHGSDYAPHMADLRRDELATAALQALTPAFLALDAIESHERSLRDPG